MGGTLPRRCRALPLRALEGALAGLRGTVSLLRPLARDSRSLAGSAGRGCRPLLRTYGGVHAGSPCRPVPVGNSTVRLGK
ncbi:hypothetical protein NicSoilB11_00080 [Arthrobacter sp. NicSoilB11]|nr:hypothetical protein StoSoilB19_00080 [Arthrobacter sp. StoSoilB19]BCW73683.1 hypothetical protein NicSoilB11_00080 [Arthrobacter sp. NicSoilB11]